VLGLLDVWDCTVAQVVLGAGDLVAIFSDGVTEAFSDDGEEFGDDRLREVLLAHRARPVVAVVEETIAVVRAFSGSEQEDDQTLVVARGR
jgi:serine phosphatase RsbU (regulator of sigma subunit)